MKKVRIKERELKFEKEAKKILDEIDDLNKNEKISFFYFFTKYGYLFHRYLTNIPIDDEIFEAETSLKRDYKLNYTKRTKRYIITVYKKYIKNNRSTCANYFGDITVLLTYSFLSNKYEKLFKESDIILENKKLNKNPIDLICEKHLLDFVESKFTISSNNIREIQLKIEELRRIIKIFKNGNDFLSTLDFKLKRKIMIEIENYLPLSRIYNSEDILKAKPIED